MERIKIDEEINKILSFSDFFPRLSVRTGDFLAVCHDFVNNWVTPES